MTAQNSRKRGSTAKRRRAARQKSMQALYQWDFDRSANSAEGVIQQFCDMQNMEKVDTEYFQQLFNYAVENIEEVDSGISPHLDRSLDQLDPIECAVLRICFTELKTQLATPYKVVVNEAVEISKDFGADKGYRYINGIADKLAAALRSAEYNADHPSGKPLSEQSSVREPLQKSPANAVKVSIKEKAPEAEKLPPKRTDNRSEKPADAPSDQRPVNRTASQNSTRPGNKPDQPARKPMGETDTRKQEAKPKPHSEVDAPKQATVSPLYTGKKSDPDTGNSSDRRKQ